MAGPGAAFEAIRCAFEMIAVRVEELNGKVKLVFLPSYRQAALIAVRTEAIAAHGQKLLLQLQREPISPDSNAFEAFLTPTPSTGWSIMPTRKNPQRDE